ncbi:MAG: 7-carboxy-7-deazaguanine synthase QueE [Bacteroidia bacterium]|nr:7-carboxy-7-deazaguanine synthase QueE [Bacteroidia bacterium]
MAVRIKTDDLMSEGLVLPVMEEFYSIQGEGFHAGKAAYFIRIGGCDVGCHWCDVKESWEPAAFPPQEIYPVIERAAACPAKTAVITGGEPCIWHLEPLTAGLRKMKLKTHLETSGAYSLSGEWDWICLSPKKTFSVRSEWYDVAHELKVIIHNRHDLEWAELQAEKVNSAAYLFLQPEWSKREETMPMIVSFILKNPKWNVSLQTHKYLGIP